MSTPSAMTEPQSSSLWMPRMAIIRNIKQEVHGVATYELALNDQQTDGEYCFLPGQFNMLYVPGVGESAISVSSDPEKRDVLAHTIRVAGNVTQALARKDPGEAIGIRGPFGSCWPMETCRGRDVVIACGGIGIAPLRPVVYTIMNHRDDYGRVVLLYGARTPDDLLYTDEYDVWRDADIQVEVTVDIGDADWRGNIGVVPVLFYRLKLDPKRTCILTCGPEIMMRFVIFEGLARRVDPDDIYLSMERNMSCGMGLCGHCQLGPTFVCKDGPVFTYREMEPYLYVEEF